LRAKVSPCAAKVTVFPAESVALRAAKVTVSGRRDGAFRLPSGVRFERRREREQGHRQLEPENPRVGKRFWRPAFAIRRAKA
jgi:hypothetical protein